MYGGDQPPGTVLFLKFGKVWFEAFYIQKCYGNLNLPTIGALYTIYIEKIVTY